MQLYELIAFLQKVEKILGGYIEVRIKYDDFDEIPLFGIIPEKQDNGDRILILE